MSAEANGDDRVEVVVWVEGPVYGVDEIERRVREWIRRERDGE